jgi:predicted O-methyltransferase YrrM
MSIGRQLVKDSSFQAFRLFDRIGIHVLPQHFYTPVQDHHWLRGNLELWARPVDLTGLDWNLDQQVAWLRPLCGTYYKEVQGLGFFRAATENGSGPGYGALESQVLHCFLRSQRPRRVIEVGSGVSTACMLHATELNAKDEFSETTITCIEPYPSRYLLSTDKIVLVRKQIQEMSAAFFDQLDSGDLLFIDSSHAVKPGSDVLTICLEVIPRLKPGVTIHVHDINLPFAYPRNVLENYFGWQETAMLLALLKGNVHLKVLSCLSALHYDRREELAQILGDYQRQEDGGPGLVSAGSPGFFPSSIWLQTL